MFEDDKMSEKGWKTDGEDSSNHERIISKFPHKLILISVLITDVNQGLSMP